MVADDVSVNEWLRNKGDTFKDVKFEDIIDEIGGNGKFQLRLNIIFNCISVIVVIMTGYAKMMAVAVPDHWCYVPGRENTRFTPEAWKNITIPREEDSYSKCYMYKNPAESNETVPCMHGWEYDKTWFSLTASSQENWVCDKAIYANTSLSLSLLFSIVIGMLLFYTGDRFGRRKQFLTCISLILIFRGLLPATSSIYPLFIAVSIIPLGAGMPSSESTLAVGIELCGIKNRSTNNFRIAFSYALGTIFIALFAWVLRNWIYFVLVPSLLCCIPLILNRFLPESPRWLVAKGKPEEAYKVLQRVAETNGTKLPDDTLPKLQYLSQIRSPNMGIRSIFTNKNLFKNTVILIWGRSAEGLAMSTLLLNSKNFGGNPFLPYIGQGLLQIPAICISHFVGNHFGRRCLHSLIVLFSAAVCFLIIVFITASSPQWMITVCSLVLQFCIQASFALTNLQSMEIHPTCVRQISMAMEYVVFTLLSCVAPYIAFVGTDIEPRYMFAILGSILFLSSLVVSFLPESLNEKLPETLEDAETYGCNQKYWSVSQRVLKSKDNVMLN